MGHWELGAGGQDESKEYLEIMFELSPGGLALPPARGTGKQNKASQASQ